MHTEVGAAELVAVARRAASPNTGWEAVCARAEAVLGARLDPVRDVDLAGDALDLRGILGELRRRLRLPRGTDTLRFELGRRTGARRRREVVLSVQGLRRGAGVWRPDTGEIVLEGLSALHRAAGAARGPAARAAWDAVLLAAAALVARFAATDLKQAVQISGGDGDAVQVAGARR